MFDINKAFEEFETARMGQTLTEQILGSFDAANINKQVANFFGKVKDAFQQAPTELLNATTAAFADGFAAIGEALGGAEEFDGKKLLGGFLKTIGLMAIQLGTMALLAAPLSLIPLFGALAGPPGLLLAIGVGLVAFGIGLTAAGAALSKGSSASGSSGGAGAGGGDIQRRRQRDRQRQLTEGGGQQAQFIIMGDFIGDDRFIANLADKINTAGKKRRVTLIASDAMTAASATATSN